MNFTQVLIGVAMWLLANRLLTLVELRAAAAKATGRAGASLEAARLILWFLVVLSVWFLLAGIFGVRAPLGIGERRTVEYYYNHYGEARRTVNECYDRHRGSDGFSRDDDCMNAIAALRRRQADH